MDIPSSCFDRQEGQDCKTPPTTGQKEENKQDETSAINHGVSQTVKLEENAISRWDSSTGRVSLDPLHTATVDSEDENPEHFLDPEPGNPSTTFQDGLTRASEVHPDRSVDVGSDDAERRELPAPTGTIFAWDPVASQSNETGRPLRPWNSSDSLSCRYPAVVDQEHDGGESADVGPTQAEYFDEDKHAKTDEKKLDEQFGDLPETTSFRSVKSKSASDKVHRDLDNEEEGLFAYSEDEEYDEVYSSSNGWPEDTSEESEGGESNGGRRAETVIATAVRKRCSTHELEKGMRGKWSGTRSEGHRRSSCHYRRALAATVDHLSSERKMKEEAEIKLFLTLELLEGRVQKDLDSLRQGLFKAALTLRDKPYKARQDVARAIEEKDAINRLLEEKVVSLQGQVERLREKLEEQQSVIDSLRKLNERMSADLNRHKSLCTRIGIKAQGRGRGLAAFYR